MKVGWVTFHQSYSYEEFIVGLRPDPASEKLLSLEPSPGLLLELAEWARVPGQSSLLVIDEINRGNVSRVFGEFITLIEPDKRLADDGHPTDRTVAINLPYIKPGIPVTVQVDGADVNVENPFTMPLRLYTLASMNSVDKSIAPLDSALRRRFHVSSLRRMSSVWQSTWRCLRTSWKDRSSRRRPQAQTYVLSPYACSHTLIPALVFIWVPSS